MKSTGIQWIVLYNFPGYFHVKDVERDDELGNTLLTFLGPNVYDEHHHLFRAVGWRRNDAELTSDEARGRNFTGQRASLR